MRRTYSAVLTLLLTCGCGLSDYEKRMDETRKRMELFDEENAVLYDMIDLPKGKNAYGDEVKVPFEPFLRLPIGLGGKFKGAEAIYYGDKLPLYRYYGSKPDVNVFVALAKIPDKKSLNKPDADEMAPQDFRAAVRLAIQDFIRREYNGHNATLPEFSQLKKEPRTVTHGTVTRTLELELIDFEDGRRGTPSVFFVYFDSYSDRQAAVVYQVAKQNFSQAFMKARDVSIKTLEISHLGPGMRVSFQYRR